MAAGALAAAVAGAVVLLAPVGPAAGRVNGSTGSAADTAGPPPVREVSLPDGIRPEGITSGPGTRFSVGSLADGRIVTGDLRTGRTHLLLAGAEGRSLRGLFHDRRSGLVWAVGGLGAVGHIWAVDARTGAIAADIVVPDAGFLNDLVVTRRAVWVTDSRVDRLTVIRLDRDGRPTGAAPSFVPLRGQWPTGDGTAINANGIRTLPDGGLVLNNSRVGGLWQVDPRTGDAREIPVTGGSPLTGGDGLERRGRTLFDVRGSGPAEVSVLRLHRVGGAHGARDAGWRAVWVEALTDPRLDVPSTATLVGDTLWAVNARFGVADPGEAAYWVTPLSVR